jgi:hypothetical protein
VRLDELLGRCGFGRVRESPGERCGRRPKGVLRVPRQPGRLLAVVYVAVVAFCAVAAGSSARGGPGYLDAVSLVLVGLGMVGVQLRHGLAAARGARPRGGPGCDR